MTAQQRFRERADSLWKLGFRSYGEYLASPMWRAIRRGVIERVKGVVGGKAEAVSYAEKDILAHFGLTDSTGA